MLAVSVLLSAVELFESVWVGSKVLGVGKLNVCVRLVVAFASSPTPSPTPPNPRKIPKGVDSAADALGTS